MFCDLWTGYKTRPKPFRAHLEEDMARVFALLADRSIMVITAPHGGRRRMLRGKFSAAQRETPVRRLDPIGDCAELQPC